jgi:hypothetical protein
MVRFAAGKQSTRGSIGARNVRGRVLALLRLLGRVWLRGAFIRTLAAATPAASERHEPARSSVQSGGEKQKIGRQKQTCRRRSCDIVGQFILPRPASDRGGTPNQKECHIMRIVATIGAGLAIVGALHLSAPSAHAQEVPDPFKTPAGFAEAYSRALADAKRNGIASKYSCEENSGIHVCLNQVSYIIPTNEGRAYVLLSDVYWENKNKQTFCVSDPSADTEYCGSNLGEIWVEQKNSGIILRNLRYHW